MLTSGGGDKVKHPKEDSLKLKTIPFILQQQTIDTDLFSKNKVASGFRERRIYHWDHVKAVQVKTQGHP
jgi:hypothetical protein